MNLNKKHTAWLSLALLLVLSVIIFAGCTDKNAGPTEIFIQNSQTPRTTYVQGQELDLSRGVLTVSEGDEQNSVPMTNDDISVTG